MISKEEFLEKLKDDEYAPGWQAIDDAFESLYPGQEPKHYATTINSRAMFGGNEYLDGFSIYHNVKGYKHLVSYGMTVLYGDEESYGGEWNGWGYEMTMKLREEKSVLLVSHRKSTMCITDKTISVENGRVS